MRDFGERCGADAVQSGQRYLDHRPGPGLALAWRQRRKQEREGVEAPEDRE